MYKKYSKLIIMIVALCVLGLLFAGAQYAQKGEEEIWGMADAKEININPKVSGRIIKICVEEGDAVKAGQPLAYLDTDSQSVERTQAQAALVVQISQLEQTNISNQNSREVLAANVRKAEADLEVAANDEKRYRMLLEQHAVSQQTYDVYASQLKNAQADYDSAQANLLQNNVNDELIRMRQEQIKQMQGQLDNVALQEREAVLRAPFDGVITKKYLEEGALISTTVPLFSLQDPTDNWVNFKVKETELDQFALGQEVKLQGRNEKLVIPGKIVHISRKPDYATIKATNERGDKDITAFDIKVQTDSSKVWPGMRFRLQ